MRLGPFALGALVAACSACGTSSAPAATAPPRPPDYPACKALAAWENGIAGNYDITQDKKVTSVLTGAPAPLGPDAMAWLTAIQDQAPQDQLNATGTRVDTDCARAGVPYALNGGKITP